MKILLPYQILAFITRGRTLKAHTITMNFKYLHQHGMIDLNYQMDLILYQIFKIILSIFKKSMEKILINHQYRYIYINNIKNRVTFTIKSGYSLELLTSERMKLLGSAKNKITKEKMVKMYPIYKLLK